MFKKLMIVGAMSAALSGAAFANGAPYIGAGIGMNNLDATNELKMNGSSFTSRVGDRGAVFNLFGGYGQTINQNLYLGGELSAEKDATEVKASDMTISIPSNSAAGNHTITANTTLSSKYSLGASVIPGVMLSEHTMAFGRVGIVRTRFESKGSVAVDNSSASFSQKNNVNGGQIGVGMQTSLTSNLDVRGEYDYTKYRSFKLGNSDNAVKVSPTKAQFNVGLVYKFE